MSGVFGTRPPSADDHELHRLGRDLFGIADAGTPVVRLDSERDQNARLGDHVLKIANRAESPDVLHLQESVLRHLVAVDPSLPVPRVVEPGTVTALVGAHEHLVRAVTWLPGRPWADVVGSLDHASATAARRSLGSTLGRLSAALSGFGHPAAHQPGFLWNLDHAQAVRSWVADIADPEDRTVVEQVFARHAHHVVPRLAALRGAVVHHDANDRNVLVDGTQISGIIDFGDMVYARQANELAVALAYALLDTPDVIAAAHDVIAAYHAEFPLHEIELEVLWELVATRLAVSVAVSSHRSREFPDNDYLRVSQASALRLLRRLIAIRPDQLHFHARHAAGLEPVPTSAEVRRWINSPALRPADVLPLDLRRAPRIVVSLAEGAPATRFPSGVEGARASWEWMAAEMAAAGAVVAIGRYDEDRSCYAGEQFATDAQEMRSVHTGIDLFIEADTPVHAPLDGVVETVVDNDLPFDYGPTVIVRHRTDTGVDFWTLYGHLSRRTLTTVAPGQVVRAGDVIGFIGDPTVNGEWAPHVHVQVMTHLMTARWHDPLAPPDGNFEGAGEPSRMDVWHSITPDPIRLLRLEPETFDERPDLEPDALDARRREVLSPSLSTSYRRHLSIVRGEGTWLIDHTGRAHLDAVNNVCHVGHSHPHVVEAIHRQAALLNTNTRYLHRTILDYAERLAALFPAPLRVVYLTNSGSEANELALRIARTVTGRHDVVAVDWGYHGNTGGLVDVSAYKFNRKGGSGRPPHTHLAALPDPYRGEHRSNSNEAARAYAASVADALERARAHDPRGAAAFLAESISGCGGQVVFPDGYLAAAYEHARADGALCIADEVQVGFGRVGPEMWAFAEHGVVPDIVTLGKPIGNGHPLGAVVTTPELAAAFANGMEWFNTFGGNPVSCAAGMAVLDVLEQESLPQRALATGTHLIERLTRLAATHECIGDVRGRGLYLGVDLVTNRATRTEHTRLAADVANALRDRGVLVSTDGPADNVLKIKPPIVFGAAEADLLAGELDEVLRSLRA